MNSFAAPYTYFGLKIHTTCNHKNHHDRQLTNYQIWVLERIAHHNAADTLSFGLEKRFLGVIGIFQV